MAKTDEKEADVDYIDGKESFFFPFKIKMLITLITYKLCVVYLITSVAEARDRALSFFKGSGIHEVVSHCHSHQWHFYCGIWRN